VANRKVQFKDEDPESDDIVEFPVSVNVVQPAVCSVRPSLLCLGHLRAIRPYDALLEQKQDPFCSTILSFIETQRFPDSVDEAQKPFLLSVAENCSIQKNGCLYYCERRSPQSPMRFERLVIPEKLKEPVFLAFHSSPSAGGHFNWRKTLAKISRKYFWPHMSEDIFALCRSCDECQRKRNQQMNREQLTPVISGAVFDKVYVDLTGPLHTSEDDNSGKHPYSLSRVMDCTPPDPPPADTDITVPAHADESDTDERRLSVKMNVKLVAYGVESMRTTMFALNLI
ncbi:hypothetical protein TELCIR_18836, partial [Teladorsagia circumcincta]